MVASNAVNLATSLVNAPMQVRIWLHFLDWTNWKLNNYAIKNHTSIFFTGGDGRQQKGPVESYIPTEETEEELFHHGTSSGESCTALATLSLKH